MNNGKAQRSDNPDGLPEVGAHRDRLPGPPAIGAIVWDYGVIEGRTSDLVLNGMRAVYPVARRASR